MTKPCAARTPHATPKPGPALRIAKWFVAVTGSLAGIVLLLGLLVAKSCQGLCREEVLARAVSPSGRFVASVELSDCGVFSGYEHAVHVTDQASPQDHLAAHLSNPADPQGKPGLDIRWADDVTLVVSFSSASAYWVTPRVVMPTGVIRTVLALAPRPGADLAPGPVVPGGVGTPPASPGSGGAP